MHVLQITFISLTRWSPPGRSCSQLVEALQWTRQASCVPPIRLIAVFETSFPYLGPVSYAFSRQICIFQIADTSPRLDLTCKAEGHHNGNDCEVKHDNVTAGGVESSKGSFRLKTRRRCDRPSRKPLLLEPSPEPRCRFPTFWWRSSIQRLVGAFSSIVADSNCSQAQPKSFRSEGASTQTAFRATAERVIESGHFDMSPRHIGE